MNETFTRNWCIGFPGAGNVSHSTGPGAALIRSPYPRWGLALGPLLLLLDQLAVARRALEGGEPRGMEHALAAAAGELAAAARGGERSGGADEPPDQEGARTSEPVVAVHGTIVPVLIATLGDVMLDVIVRLEQPLAPGADARCIAKRGADPAGELVAAQLAALGVELVGPVAAGATGVVVSLVAEDGDRSMASDRGVSPTLAPDELEAPWLDCDVLHL